MQLTYILTSAYVGVRLACRGDTGANHVNYMNQVIWLDICNLANA